MRDNNNTFRLPGCSICREISSPDVTPGRYEKMGMSATGFAILLLVPMLIFSGITWYFLVDASLLNPHKADPVIINVSVVNTLVLWLFFHFCLRLYQSSQTHRYYGGVLPVDFRPLLLSIAESIQFSLLLVVLFRLSFNISIAQKIIMVLHLAIIPWCFFSWHKSSQLFRRFGPFALRVTSISESEPTCTIDIRCGKPLQGALKLNAILAEHHLKREKSGSGAGGWIDVWRRTREYSLNAQVSENTETTQLSMMFSIDSTSIKWNEAHDAWQSSNLWVLILTFSADSLGRQTLEAIVPIEGT
jgi:hypothetical protein